MRHELPLLLLEIGRKHNAPALPESLQYVLVRVLPALYGIFVRGIYGVARIMQLDVMHLRRHGRERGSADCTDRPLITQFRQEAKDLATQPRWKTARLSGTPSDRYPPRTVSLFAALLVAVVQPKD